MSKYDEEPEIDYTESYLSSAETIQLTPVRPYEIAIGPNGVPVRGSFRWLGSYREEFGRQIRDSLKLCECCQRELSEWIVAPDSE